VSVEARCSERNRKERKERKESEIAFPTLAPLAVDLLIEKQAR
jgi:hypothetical protein